MWQDFLLACAAYAEEEPLRSEVVAEAREAVTRLSPHPSLALWNGGNENLWGFADWGWQEVLDGRTWGHGYYYDVFPAIVAELDPTRPYSPGSPYSPDPALHPNDPAHGTMHIWDVWNTADYTVYRDYRPRFLSEFGFQGPPAWSTLTRSVHDDPLASDSPGVLAHQKAEDGNGKLARGIDGHLPEPVDVEDWHWATSLNQARAVATGVEHFRSLMPLCMGTVLWQLNDCWPVTSWAAIDGDGRLKPLWYALRHSYRDRLVTVQPRDGGLGRRAGQRLGAAVARASSRWRACASTAYGWPSRPAPSTWRRRSVVTVVLPTAVGDRRGRGYRGGPGRARWRTRAGGTSPRTSTRRCPSPSSRWPSRTTPEGYRLTVTTQAFLRDLAVLADRLAPDAVVDDMLVTLLPGESATFQRAHGCPTLHGGADRPARRPLGQPARARLMRD